MNLSKLLIYVLSMSLFISCVGYPGKVSRTERLSGFNQKSVDVVFTGFSKYHTESKLIAEALEDLGYRFDASASLLLEVILEEEDAKYKYNFLHFVNLVTSIVSLTTIPYHVQTEHKLTFRFRNKGIIQGEIELKTVFHQWRGVLFIPITFFFWPSSEFEQYLLSSVKSELIKE